MTVLYHNSDSAIQKVPEGTTSLRMNAERSIPEDLLAWSEKALWPDVREEYVDWAVAVPYRLADWKQDPWWSFHNYSVWKQTQAQNKLYK